MNWRYMWLALALFAFGAALGFSLFLTTCMVLVGLYVFWFLERQYAPFVQSEVEHQSYSLAVTALSALIAKADGVVSPDEIKAFRNAFYMDEADKLYAGKLFDLFRERQPAPEKFIYTLSDICKTRPKLGPATFQGFVEIASCGGLVHPSQEKLLQQIAAALKVPYGQQKQQHKQQQSQQKQSEDARKQAEPVELAAAYKTLGLTPAATDTDVKAQYRKLVRQHHPDKLRAQGASESKVKAADQKLAAINSAYKLIKK